MCKSFLVYFPLSSKKMKIIFLICPGLDENDKHYEITYFESLIEAYSSYFHSFKFWKHCISKVIFDSFVNH